MCRGQDNVETKQRKGHIIQLVERIPESNLGSVETEQIQNFQEQGRCQCRKDEQNVHPKKWRLLMR